jgi:hypothetical protein
MEIKQIESYKRIPGVIIVHTDDPQNRKASIRSNGFIETTMEKEITCT